MTDHSEQPDNPGYSLNNESGMFTTPNKKIELTEADYAGAPSLENGLESTKSYNEFGDVSAAHSTSQTHTGMAMTFGLIGVAGAVAALWMNFTLSDRIDRLATQLSSSQKITTVFDQRKEITSLNQRMGTLETTVSSLMAATSKPAPAMITKAGSSGSSTIAVKKSKTLKQESQGSPLNVRALTAPPIKPNTTDMQIPSGHHQGVWVINLISLGNATSANHELKRLGRLGIHAESTKVDIHGKTWYRISLPGFPSAEEANRQRKVLASRLNIRDTWINKR